MPFGFDDAAMAALSMLSGLFGGGKGDQQQGFQPTDVYSRQGTFLIPQSEEEKRLAMQQQLLAALGMGQVQGDLSQMPGLAGLVQGQLPAASMERIRQTSMGGLQEAGRQISRQSQERAMAQGNPMSSYQYAMEGELMRPLAAQAAQMQGQLQMQELSRLAGLRDQTLQNSIAMQAAPALQRLLQIRMAQPQQRGLQQTQQSGTLGQEAYGGWSEAYGQAGPRQIDPQERQRRQLELDKASRSWAQGLWR